MTRIETPSEYKSWKTGKESNNRKMWRGCAVAILIFSMVAVLFVYFVFFRPGPYAIVKATAQDYVWSVEPRQNNSTMLWLRNSELGAFCTADTALVSQLDKIAEDMKNGEVFIYFEYRSINNGDAEKQYLGAGDGCATERGSITIYKLLTVKEVSFSTKSN